AQSSDLIQQCGHRLRSMGVAPEELLDATENDYLLWAFVCHRQEFASRQSDEDAAGLKAQIDRRTDSWHPTLRRIVSETDAMTIQRFDFSTAKRIKPWRTGPVTLLGDALHYMPPVGGMGGNAALHDARIVCGALQSVAAGRMDLVPALHEAEARM